jgi:hypothetical protein
VAVVGSAANISLVSLLAKVNIHAIFVEQRLRPPISGCHHNAIVISLETKERRCLTHVCCDVFPPLWQACKWL